MFRVQEGDIDVGGDDDGYLSNVVDNVDDDKHKNILVTCTWTYTRSRTYILITIIAIITTMVVTNA